MKNPPSSPPAAETEKAAAAGAAEAQSRTATVDHLIRTLTADLATLTRTKGELGLALVVDPKNADILERIEVNEEQLAAVSRRLELYRQARVQAEHHDRGAQAKDSALRAVAYRDEAVAAAQSLVKVGARLEEHIAQLGALLAKREDVLDAIARAAGLAVRESMSSLSFEDRARSAPRWDLGWNRGDGALALALKKSGVVEASKGYVEISGAVSTYGMSVEQLARSTIPSQAERMAQLIQDHLDRTLREIRAVSGGRGPDPAAPAQSSYAVLLQEGGKDNA